MKKIVKVEEIASVKTFRATTVKLEHVKYVLRRPKKIDTSAKLEKKYIKSIAKPLNEVGQILLQFKIAGNEPKVLQIGNVFQNDLSYKKVSELYSKIKGVMPFEIKVSEQVGEYFLHEDTVRNWVRAVNVRENSSVSEQKFI